MAVDRDVASRQADYLTTGIGKIDGWFFPVDQRLFIAVDGVHRERGMNGDLLEIGVYRGKSAILLGFMRKGVERVVLCDTFDTGSSDAFDLYEGLAERQFRENWRRFHATDPTVLVGRSDVVLDELADNSCRVVHIDGSHEYEVVRTDIETAQRVLAPGGVVILDDVSSPHTPGVAAATWEAVTTGGLLPLALGKKLYATWTTDIRPADMHRVLTADSSIRLVRDHRIAGSTVLQFEAATKFRWSMLVPPIMSSTAYKVASLLRR